MHRGLVLNRLVNYRSPSVNFFLQENAPGPVPAGPETKLLRFLHEGRKERREVVRAMIALRYLRALGVKVINPSPRISQMCADSE
jgi:hypothetical protein